jgi:cytochrome P450
VTEAGAAAWTSGITVAELDADPYPVYARMRREAPVCFVPAVGLWFVTRWSGVEYAASHPDLIDSRVTPSPLDRTMGGASILVLDGEPQRELRAMLDPSLRPRVVEETTPGLIEPLVASLLDGLEERGRAELMAELFEPVSVLGLGRILGLGHLEGDTLRRWFHGLAEGAVNFEDDPARWAVADATGAEIDRELAPVLERLWDEPDGSTIATMLERAHGTFEERVAQILPTLKVILLGGMQEPGHAAGTTVAGLLLSGQADVVAADPAGRVRDAIEEGLRWVSPIGTQTRRAKTDVEIDGVAVPAGANLGALVSSANRDEAVWGPTADVFDIGRPRRNHAAFGFGPHFCSGHHFSRVLMRIAVRRLFERLPGLRLDPGSPPVFTGWEFRAPRNLDVLWDA